MWSSIEHIKEIISNSINKTDVLNKLELKNNGGNYNTLTRFIKVNNVDISHFHENRMTKQRRHYNKIKMSDILIENSPYSNTNSLKNRLYREDIKKRKCELCDQGEEWMGKKMSLILDHINGDRHDNRIENLRIVCPNCNATLETHCRGLKICNKNNRHDQCSCGGLKRKKSEMCINCYRNKISENNEVNKKEKKDRKETRKVKRPPHHILINEIKELGYVATGKKYGVSDNSIRKWIKMYEKNGLDW